MKNILSKMRFYYNAKGGYRHYIGFYTNSDNKLKFTTKGLSFTKNK